MVGNLLELHIGIDDTDSPRGMCTTFLGVVLLRVLTALGCSAADDPYLVRLNPNIPFKTRGNGAVALHVLAPSRRVRDVVTIVHRLVETVSERHGKTKPAAVIVRGVTPSLRYLYKRALVDVVPLRLAERVLKELDARGLLVDAWHRGRGLVGALAALGAFPMRRCTYELLVYRGLHVKSRERGVSFEYALRLDRATRPLTFANLDYERRRPLISPHGPDPVIAGIRSFSKNLLERLAKEAVRDLGGVLWAIFKTNQGLGLHTRKACRISDIRPYQSVNILGYVAGRPRVTRGGHVFFRLRLRDAQVLCAVFKETGRLNRVARMLREGDLVEVVGGVSPPDEGREKTVNVEALRVIRPAPLAIREYPRCPLCGSRMTSAGRGKGLKCKKCGYTSTELKPSVKTRPRVLEPGLYIQSPRAYRHLSLTLRCIWYVGCTPEF